MVPRSGTVGLQTDFLLFNGQRAGQTNIVRQSYHDISSRGLKCIKIVFFGGSIFDWRELTGIVP